MQFNSPESEIYVADGMAEDQALARTTMLGVAAHQDDLEILGYNGIARAFGRRDEWFTGVVVTDGRGSPRNGLYADYTDEEMREVRRHEQRKAAMVGEYASMIMLDYPSAAVKSGEERVVEDLARLLEATAPEVIYTHNPADKHDTHVAVMLRLLEAVRRLPDAKRPKAIYGCEVWRDLDWLPDERKIVLRTDMHENLAAALLGVFDSQITGGKRYDLATMGRRRAHATFFASHDTDVCEGMTLAMDLMPLVQDETLAPADFVAGLIAEFANEVNKRIAGLR